MSTGHNDMLEATTYPPKMVESDVLVGNLNDSKTCLKEKAL